MIVLNRCLPSQLRALAARERDPLSEGRLSPRWAAAQGWSVQGHTQPSGGRGICQQGWEADKQSQGQDPTRLL